jgi:hypothetical protein
VALEGILGAVLGGALSVVLPKLFGGSQGWSVKLSRFFGWVKLGYVRAAGGAVFGIAVSAAIGLSTSNEPHQTVTYFAWYGVAFLGLAVAIAATVLIDRRTAPSTPQRGLAFGPGDLARQHTSLGTHGRTQGRRTGESSDSTAKPGRSNGPLSALEKLYTEGDNMLKAGNPMVAISFGGHGPPPTDARIDDWIKRVLAALPAQYRGSFKVSSLKAKGANAIVLAALSSPESAQIRRLRPHVQELEQIIGKMSYP